ncbi:hypothetical protein [Gracilibacillus timonensis]|uniref:hypothetical protein n=1 Tax=Gracilibacillus timonensis TaxID=1816696 RepID=UPI0008246B96|nr:hypothetical protein [Gracilibacillus timonensis]
MSRHEDDLIKELKALKTNRSLDTQKKDGMRMALQEHAAKKQKQQRRKVKVKQTFMRFSTAAAILIFGVFVYYFVSIDQLPMPSNDQESSRENEMHQEDLTMPEEEETTDENEAAFSIEEQGTEIGTIMLEDSEQEETLYNYTIEPYGIDFQMREFLANYTVEGEEVHFSNDVNYDSIDIRLWVAESTTIEDMIPEVQQRFGEVFDNAEEPEATTDDNPYEGVTQSISDPPQGYYLYQIDDNVLVIQYEYGIAAADGMAAAWEVLLNSIE